MKVTNVVYLSTALPLALAWPGMAKLKTELEATIQARQVDTGSDGFDSNELIGDLVTVGAISPVAKQIQAIIVTGTTDGYSSEVYTTPVPKKGTTACAADTCCIWSYIAADMYAKFRGGSGRCNGLARAAVRMGFHDAGAWSKTSKNGGADGSLILAGEMSRTENNGLQTVVAYTQTLYNSYKSYGVSMADLIQMAATVGAVTCPLGPRVRSYVGRIDSSIPAPDGLLPDVHASADSLLQLFADKTIKAHGLAALVGAHTSSQQRFVDTTRSYDPQDTTPGVWDVSFYNTTIQPDSVVPKRVFKFASDVALANHPSVKAEWNKWAAGDQNDWDEDYAREYVRLSLLGVNNINSLTECTKVLPAAVTSFTNPDNAIIKQWLSGKWNILGKYLDGGDTLSALLLALLGIQ
jgi:hypothetical protein